MMKSIIISFKFKCDEFASYLVVIWFIIHEEKKIMFLLLLSISTIVLKTIFHFQFIF
jgi:hypothetical protein